MKKLFILFAGAILFFTACSEKGQSGTDAVNTADKAFASTAGPLYRAQFEMGSLAFNNSADSGIVRLAEQVLKTSNLAFMDLVYLADLKSFYVSSSMDQAHIALRDSLANMSGTALDSAFLHLLVEDQHVLLSAYDVVKQSGNNLSLRAHANAYGDTMLMYHEVADSLIDLY
jgi:hypothetical protein